MQHFASRSAAISRTSYPPRSVRSLRSVLLGLFGVVGLSFGSLGCHRRAQPPAAAPQVQAHAPAQLPKGAHIEHWPGLGNVVVPNGTPKKVQGNGERHHRKHRATVYIDGVPRLAFTYNEMPPEVKTVAFQWQGKSYEHIRVCDFFRALGADCSRVKSSFWYGGNSNFGIVTGEQLRKNRRTLYFDFSRGLSGKPRLEWPDNLKTNNKVDVVTDLAIFVHKKPPRYDAYRDALFDDKGQTVDGIPYFTGEPPRDQVRVNVDGRLVAQIKRQELEDQVKPASGSDDDARYRLSDFLKANHIAAPSFRGIDLVNQDERVIHVSPAAWKHGLEFSAPRHGELTVYLGAQQVGASVFNLYVKKSPPERSMRTLTLGTKNRGVASPPPGAAEKTQVITGQGSPY